MNAAAGTRSERLVTKMPEEKKMKAPAKKKTAKKSDGTKKLKKKTGRPRKKKPAGRPLKYETPEALQAAIDNYFETAEINSRPFKIVDLCLFIGFTKDMLSDYENREGFSFPVKQAKMRVESQYEDRLINRGSSGDVFALKNFGWTDRVETVNKTSMEITGSVESFLKSDDGGINM